MPFVVSEAKRVAANPRAHGAGSAARLELLQRVAREVQQQLVEACSGHARDSHASYLK